MIKVKITNHSILRGYDRMAKDSIELMDKATVAYNEGKSSYHTKGKLYDFLRPKIAHNEYGTPNIEIKVYDGFIWIYANVPSPKPLITFYKIPKKLKFYQNF